MRTTLTIDDGVLAAARELAAIEEKIKGEVISALVRQSLRPGRESDARATEYRSYLFVPEPDLSRLSWYVGSTKNCRERLSI